MENLKRSAPHTEPGHGVPVSTPVFTMHEMTFGLFLVLAAGLLNSIYAIPVRRMSRWEFENTWLIYSLVGMGIISWTVAWWSVPNLWEAYRCAGSRAVCSTIAFGAVWGVANLLFGLGIRWIGMGLAFPICIGLSLVLGTMVPLFAKGSLIFTPSGLMVTAGVSLVLIGVILCARAGVLRERNEASSAVLRTGVLFWGGLFVIVFSGLMDPCLNFAFAFGDSIRTASSGLGGAAAGAESDGIWALALSGSLVVNAVYCTVLLIRKGSWTKFFERKNSFYWLGAASMGVAWTLSITLYGRGATAMGRLGDSTGWALFYCAIILFSAVWAILMGEWKTAGNNARKLQWFGLGLILMAILVLGYANSLEG
jgi:L-rhamnose-H+ transport protein